MKKALTNIVLLVCIMMLAALAGCGAGTNVPSAGASPEKDEYFYDESTGKVYTDKSENFDFKMEHWKYHHNKETEVDEIVFGLLIKNKRIKDKKNFVCNITFDDRAQAIIPEGTYGYNGIKEPPIDMSNASGIGYNFELPVVDRGTLKNMPDGEQLLDYIRNVTLSLSWDGGQETVNLVLDKLEYEG